MPNYGYGGLYQPQYAGADMSGNPVLTKAQISGPQPQVMPTKMGGPGAPPQADSSSMADPYQLHTSGDALNSYYKNTLSQMPGPSIGHFQNYGQGTDRIAAQTQGLSGWSYTPLYSGSYQAGDGRYVPYANDTSRYINTVQRGGSTTNNPMDNNGKRLVSFEDMRGAYQNAMMFNNAGGQNWQANNNLSLAYQNLVDKMKSTGQFGVSGRFNQRTGYTGG